MPDLPALYATLDRVIDAAPRGLWDQHRWVKPMEACQTAGCFAGHYAFSRGFTQYRREFGGGEYMVNPGTGGRLSASSPDNSDSIAVYAMRGLRLSGHEADVLFHPDNTLEDLKHLIDALSAGEDIEYLHYEDDGYGDYEEYEDPTC